MARFDLQNVQTADVLQRLKKLCGYEEWSDLADLLKVSESTISAWKRRNTLKVDKLITPFEGLNAHWLLYGEGDSFSDGVRKIHFTDSNGRHTIYKSLLDAKADGVLDVEEGAAIYVESGGELRKIWEGTEEQAEAASDRISRKLAKGNKNKPKPIASPPVVIEPLGSYQRYSQPPTTYADHIRVSGVQVAGEVHAGIPTLSGEQQRRSLAETLGLDRNRHMIVRVASNGDTAPGFVPGDVVIIDTQKKPQEGSFVFASVAGSPAIVRIMTPDSMEQNQVRVVGVVIFVIETF